MAIWRTADTPAVVILERVPRGLCGIDLELLLKSRDVLADRTKLAGRHLIVANPAWRHRLPVKSPESTDGDAFVIVPDECREAQIAALSALHGRHHTKRAPSVGNCREPTPFQRTGSH